MIIDVELFMKKNIVWLTDSKYFVILSTKTNYQTICKTKR